jgi:hypothetical protein
MSISTLGAIDTGSDSPVDRATTVVLFVVCRHLPSIFFRFETSDIISAFVIAENGRKTISAARGCKAGSEATVRFLDPDLVSVGLGILQLSFTCQKFFDFSICM